jgi:putative hydrolase of the HAD superfamily
MIGNSPKSDILPARDAGLKAVFIPNENTWALEHGELDPDDADVLHLKSFADLVLHF